MCRIRSILTGCFLAFLMVPQDLQAEAYGSGWYGEIQGSYGYEDNISRTWVSDTPDDLIASISVGGGYSTKVGSNAQLILSGYLFYTEHNRYEALDNWAVSLGADYTIQPRVSYDAPWYNIKINVSNFEFRDSDSRESVVANADLSVNRRLSTVLTGHLGYRYADRFFVNKSSVEERNDAAFETSAHELYLGIDYQLKPFIYVFAEYVYRHGDVLSNLPGGPSPGWNTGGAVYDAQTLDPVFDNDCQRRCVAGYTYRTRGNTQIAAIGIAFPVRALGIDVDVSGTYYDAEGQYRSYKDWMMKLGVIWNF